MNSAQHDVVVVGGGPAGATAAGYLAKLGYDVLILEREHFPRHHVGESLLPSMVPVLEDFGLVDEMARHGFAHKTGGAFKWGKDAEPWEVRFATNEFLPAAKAWHVERAVFDDMLLRHAASVGARVVEGASVKDVLREGERCVGVVWADEDGERHEARSRYVIDASGSRAAVARQMTTRHYDDKMRQIAFYTYWKDVAGLPPTTEHFVHITSTRKGWFWFIPLENSELGDASVGFVTGQEFREEYQALGPEAFYQQALEETPRLKQYLGDKATRTQPLRTVADWAYSCERAAGPGWFAAGDAAAFLDPLFSTGVTLAMLAGYSASVCVHTVLSGEVEAEQAADFYNGNYRHMYDITRDFIHYFYAANTVAGSDEIFWKARNTLNLDDNIGARQAFSWLINTIPANPHPAVGMQIQMFQNFMDQVDHPLAALEASDGLRRFADEAGAWAAWEGHGPEDVPRVNGELEHTFVIDRDRHALDPVVGVRYDNSRPVFSSTSSWLMGRNIHPLEPEDAAVLDAMDGTRTWGEIVARHADTHDLSIDDAFAALQPRLDRLSGEGFVLARAAPAADTPRQASA